MNCRRLLWMGLWVTATHLWNMPLSCGHDAASTPVSHLVEHDLLQPWSCVLRKMPSFVEHDLTVREIRNRNLSTRQMARMALLAVIIRSMRRLLPDPVDHITVAEAYRSPRPWVDGRPWVGLCMVCGLDGSTVVDDNSRALSSPADTEVLLGLRRLADVIVVGASTVRIEGYRTPSKPGQRLGVVSRTGAGIDYTNDLFTSGAGFVIVPETAPDLPVETVRAGFDHVDFAAALTQVGDRMEATFVQAEGGAALNAALAMADVIDELNLTVSPVISGGDGHRVTSGAPPLLHRMDLAHVLEDDGFLFTRYLRRR